MLRVPGARSFRCVKLACVFVAMASVVLPVCAAPKIESIAVVTDDNFPPFVFRNADGETEGYLVDLWQLWEKKQASAFALPR